MLPGCPWDSGTKKIEEFYHLPHLNHGSESPIGDNLIHGSPSEPMASSNLLHNCPAHVHISDASNDVGSHDVDKAASGHSPPQTDTMKLFAAAATAGLIVATEGAAIGSNVQSVLQSVLLGLNESQQSSKPPNILFVITDDQDLQLDSISYTPLIQKHLRDKGTFFRNHFVTTALCCPSRVSLWTGRQAHNTNVTDVNPPYGECDLEKKTSCSRIEIDRFQADTPNL